MSADDLERADLSVGFPSSISIKPSSLSPIHYSSPFSSSVSLFLWLSWQNQGIFLSDCSCVLLCIHSKITINLKFGRDNSSDFLLSRFSSRRQPRSAATCLPGPLCSKQRLGMAAEATTTTDIMRNMTSTTMLTTLRLPQ